MHVQKNVDDETYLIFTRVESKLFRFPSRISRNIRCMPFYHIVDFSGEFIHSLVKAVGWEQAVHSDEINEIFD